MPGEVLIARMIDLKDKEVNNTQIPKYSTILKFMHEDL